MDRSTVVAQTETVTRGHMSLGGMPCLYYMGQGMPGMVRMASWLGARAAQLLLEPQAGSSVGVAYHQIRRVITVIGKSQWHFP